MLHKLHIMQNGELGLQGKWYLCPWCCAEQRQQAQHYFAPAYNSYINELVHIKRVHGMYIRNMTTTVEPLQCEHLSEWRKCPNYRCVHIIGYSNIMNINAIFIAAHWIIWALELRQAGPVSPPKVWDTLQYRRELDVAVRDSLQASQALIEGQEARISSSLPPVLDISIYAHVDYTGGESEFSYKRVNRGAGYRVNAPYTFRHFRKWCKSSVFKFSCTLSLRGSRRLFWANHERCPDIGWVLHRVVCAVAVRHTD